MNKSQPETNWCLLLGGKIKYHFPMYLKEIEYRFNHRRENLFRSFIRVYFGYVSP